MSVRNISVLPMQSPPSPAVVETSNSSIVVVTPKTSDVPLIKQALGGTFDLTVCATLNDFCDLMRRSRDTAMEIVLVRDLMIENNPDVLKRISKHTRPHTPVLVMGEKGKTAFSTLYAKSRIRDIVLLDDAGHMRFVVKRELQNYRVRCAYKHYASRAAKYRRQLKRLIKLTPTAAAADTPVATEAPAATNIALPTTINDRARLLDKFSKRLAKELQRGVRVLAWIRVDQFRTVEAALGIIASEEALEHIACVLRNLRHPGDLSGRMGGTVFAVLLERGTMEDVEAWVEQFYRSLNARPFVCDGKTAQLSCTTGICEVGSKTDAIETIFSQAHDACRRGRLQGEGHIFLSASSKSARSARLQDKKWARRMKLALSKDRFQLVHSPIVRLDGENDKIRDTWVRMIDEKGNTILPKEFIPVAKRLGLMTLIDRWIIAATLSYCIKRKPNLVFVRLSESTILDDTLAAWIEKVFRDSTVKSSQLCFQITATVATRHMTHIVRQAKKLNELGFKFSVEKIGDTPAMMDVLDLVPMQYARIDAGLSQRVANDKTVHDRVGKIISAAKARGIFVVADHIENAETMATLCQLDVEFMQGDYLRRDNIVMEDTMTVCKPILPPTESR